jgi:hypothetical protein
VRKKYVLTIVAVVFVGIVTTVVWDQTYAKSRDAPPYGSVLSIDGIPVDG